MSRPEVPEFVEPTPLLFRKDRAAALAAAGLVALGFVAGALTQWFSGVMLK